jgi:hypothetical protein
MMWTNGIKTNLKKGERDCIYVTQETPVLTSGYVSLLRTAALGLLCDLRWTFQLPPPGVSTRVTAREHPAAEGGTLGEKCPGILCKYRLSRYI